MLIDGLIRGDLRKITEEAREILQSEGCTSWNITKRTVSYHMKRMDKRSLTRVGILVKELVKMRIEVNTQDEQHLKAVVSAA